MRYDPLAREAEKVDWSKFEFATARCPNCKQPFAGHAAYLKHWGEVHGPKSAKNDIRKTTP